MKKRTSNLDGVLMMLEILKRIPRRRRITANEIQGQLADAGYERDLRSIQRHMDILSAHFDIERDDRSKPYGYRWKEQASGLSIPTLSEKESMLLTLAEQHLRNLLPAGLFKSMEGFFSQARYKLDHSVGDGHDREWLEKVRVVSTTQPLLPPVIAPDVFDEVSNALYANHWLEVHYVNLKKQDRTDQVMPLGLGQQGSRLYLVCRFKGHDNERSLPLNRIYKANDTGIPFKRPRNFDLKKFEADGGFGYGEGKRIKLVFRITKGYGDHILESRLSHDQQVKDLGKKYEISATVVESEQLRWWLRSFGREVKMIEPADFL